MLVGNVIASPSSWSDSGFVLSAKGDLKRIDESIYG